MGSAGSVPASREAALAAGYSEQDIEAHLQQLATTTTTTTTTTVAVVATALPDGTPMDGTPMQQQLKDNAMPTPQDPQESGGGGVLSSSSSSSSSPLVEVVLGEGPSVVQVEETNEQVAPGVGDPQQEQEQTSEAKGGENGGGDNDLRQVRFGVVDEVQMDLDLRSDNKLELGWKETGRTVKRLSQHEMDNKATNFERGFPRRIPTMDRFEMVTSAHEKLLEHEAEEARAAEEEKRTNPPCPRCQVPLLSAPRFVLDGREEVLVVSSLLHAGTAVVKYKPLPAQPLRVRRHAALDERRRRRPRGHQGPQVVPRPRRTRLRPAAHERRPSREARGGGGERRGRRGGGGRASGPPRPARRRRRRARLPSPRGSSASRRAPALGLLSRGGVVDDEEDEDMGEGEERGSSSSKGSVVGRKGKETAARTADGAGGGAVGVGEAADEAAGCWLLLRLLERNLVSLIIGI